MTSRRHNLAVQNAPLTVSGAASVEHLSYTLVEKIEPEVWKEWLKGKLSDEQLKLQGDALLRVIYEYLQSDSLPGEIQEALQFVSDLDDEIGHDAIRQAAEQHGQQIPDENKEPASLALRLWLTSETNFVWLSVLKAAWFGIATKRQLVKSLKEFAGKGNSKRVIVTEQEAQFGESLDPIMKEMKLVFQKAWFLEHDNLLTISILFGGREQTHVVAHDKKRSRLRQRWACCDIVRYDKRNDRLAIVSRYSKLTEHYRRLIGQILFGDSEYFAGEELWSLESLRGDLTNRLNSVRKELDLREARIRRVVWQSNGNGRAAFEGNDAHEMLRQLCRGTTGTIIEAEFALIRYGYKINRARVRVKPPNRIECPEGIHRELAIQFLHLMGFANGNNVQVSLWSLCDGAHPCASFEQALRSDINSLEESGFVSKCEREFYFNHAPAESGILLRREGRGDSTFAISDDATDLASSRVDSTETDAWQLNPKKLATHLGQKLRLEGSVQTVEGTWLWDIGFYEVENVQVRVLLLLGHPPNTIDRTLFAWSQKFATQRLVVVMPSSESLKAEIAQVTCSDLLAPPPTTLESILRAGGITHPPLEVLGYGVDLIVAEASKRVLLFGQTVELTDDQFELLVHEVKRQQGGHSTKVLAADSKKRATKESVRSGKKRMREALERAGLARAKLHGHSKLFEKHGSSYRLAVKARLLEHA